MAMEEFVLIVDDEYNSVELMKSFCGMNGIPTLEAHNGKKGLALYKKEHARVRGIISDYNMPVMNGEEMTKAIRQYEAENNLKKTQITIVTGEHLDGKFEKRLKQAGVDRILQKPCPLEELLKIIKK